MPIDQRVRLDDVLAADVQAYAKKYSINVTDAIRVLLRKGLESEERNGA
jgi:antitoxin component of RelBE/YafQ-DinJ toxin-antitoxin module